MNEHQIGDTVYIAGLSNGNLTPGIVVHCFIHNNEQQYVIEIETVAGTLLEVRSADLTATDPTGPLLMWAKLTRK